MIMVVMMIMMMIVDDDIGDGDDDDDDDDNDVGEDVGDDVGDVNSRIYASDLLFCDFGGSVRILSWNLEISLSKTNNSYGHGYQL